MVDTSDPNVLSYLRKEEGAKSAVLVAMNFTGQAQTVSYQLAKEGLTSSRAEGLLEDQGMNKEVNLRHMTLPPFAVFIGKVR